VLKKYTVKRPRQLVLYSMELKLYCLHLNKDEQPNVSKYVNNDIILTIFTALVKNNKLIIHLFDE